MLSTVSPLVAAAPLMQASFGLSDLVYRQLGLMAEKVFKWPDTSPIGDSNAGALTHFRYHSIILSAGSKRGDPPYMPAGQGTLFAPIVIGLLRARLNREPAARHANRGTEEPRIQ